MDMKEKVAKAIMDKNGFGAVPDAALSSVGGAGVAKFLPLLLKSLGAGGVLNAFDPPKAPWESAAPDAAHKVWGVRS